MVIGAANVNAYVWYVSQEVAHSGLYEEGSCQLI